MPNSEIIELPEITKHGKQIIEDVYSQYDKTDLPDESPLQISEGRKIIHLYPERDTFNKDGSPEGYRDSLFFTVRIFDFDEAVYYEIKTKDGIDLNGILPKVRVFKDGSTMLVINEGISVDFYFQCMQIHPIL